MEQEDANCRGGLAMHEPTQYLLDDYEDSGLDCMYTNGHLLCGLNNEIGTDDMRLVAKEPHNDHFEDNNFSNVQSGTT